MRCRNRPGHGYPEPTEQRATHAELRSPACDKSMPSAPGTLAKVDCDRFRGNMESVQPLSALQKRIFGAVWPIWLVSARICLFWCVVAAVYFKANLAGRSRFWVDRRQISWWNRFYAPKLPQEHLERHTRRRNHPGHEYPKPTEQRATHAQLRSPARRIHAVRPRNTRKG